MPTQRDPDAIERDAVAAYLAGDDTGSDRLWIEAYREWVGRGDEQRSMRCAFWLAFRLLNAGDEARGQGWALRAERQAGGQQSLERGYVSYLSGLRAIFSGRVEPAVQAFRAAVEVAGRYDDSELGGPRYSALEGGT